MNCGRAKKATETRKITIGVDAKHFVTADLYVPPSDAAHSALVVALAKNDEPKKWSAFGHKLAEMNYAVMVVRDVHSTRDDPPMRDNFVQIIYSALAYLRSQSNVRIHRVGVMGVGQAGISAIQVAGRDSTVAAVITLCASTRSRGAEIDSALGKLPPRPLLVIASTKDAMAPAEESQALYDAAKDPKKLVWLATDQHGTGALAADVEPIVRRVILMLLERYVK